MNLAAHRLIGNLQLQGFPGFQLDLQRFLRQDIPVWRLYFLQGVFPCGQLAVQLDFAVLIGGKLAQQVLLGVVQQESGVLQGFSCLTVNLLDFQRTQRNVCDFYPCRFAILDFNGFGGGIQGVACWSLGFLEPILSGGQLSGNGYFSRCVGRRASQGIPLLVVKLEHRAGQRFLGFPIHLLNLQCSKGCIGDFQLQRIPFGNLNFQGLAKQSVTLRGGQLPKDILSSQQLSGYLNDSKLVGGIIPYDLVPAVGQPEHRSGEGFPCLAVNLLDFQTAQGDVGNFKFNRFPRLQLNGSWIAVQNIPFRGLNLFQGIFPCGQLSGKLDDSPVVGGVFTKQFPALI